MKTNVSRLQEAIATKLTPLRNLLYWVFFQPRAFRHLPKAFDSKLDEPLSFTVLRQDSRLQKELLKYISLTLLITLALNFLAGGLIALNGARFDWWKSLLCLLMGVIFALILGAFFGHEGGIAGGIAVGVGVASALLIIANFFAQTSGTGSLAFCVTLGLVVGISFGFGGGLAGGLAVGLALAFTAGVGLGLVGGLGGPNWFIPAQYAIAISLGAAVCVSGSVAGRLATLMLGGLTIALLGSYSFGFGDLLFFLSLIRLPFYLVECLIATWLYRVRAAYSTTPAYYFSRSPVCFDDMLILPQPFLSSFLRLVVKQNVEEGLKIMATVAINPFQRWAVHRALRQLLEYDGISFFYMLNQLLRYPKRYQAVSNHRNELERAKDEYLTTKLLLTELTEGSLERTEDNFARYLYFWLRRKGESPYAPLAKAYYNLLEQTTRTDDVLNALKNLRGELYGEEFYQFIRVANTFMQYENATRIAGAREILNPLLKISNPLRPEIQAAFLLLDEVAVNTRTMVKARYAKMRTDAWREASNSLERVRQAAASIYQPEQSILLEIVEIWRRLLVEAEASAFEEQSVQKLDNPYVAGRPIRPDERRLFVGRDQELAEIEMHLQSNVSIVLHGQRRIGKTSILLNLQDHLPVNLLPVYINLQAAPPKNTYTWLKWLADTIGEHLSDRRWPSVSVPNNEKFRIGTFTTFHRFLKELERKLQKRKIVLIFDEFEELEEMVENSNIDRNVFKALRGYMQEFHHFVFVFAGLHTLEEMTHDYWSPFFQSVKRVAITYLNPTAAHQLITEPVENYKLVYDKDAVELIYRLTHGHPYLLQDLCFNLVSYLNEPLRRSNRATISHVEAVVEKQIRSGNYYFTHYLWDDLNNDQRLALSVIAESAESQPENWVKLLEIRRYLTAEQATESLDALCKRDILEGEGTDYRFQVELARLWVLKLKPLARIQLELAAE